MAIKLVLDGARMQELLRSPLGPLGRHLIERGEIVKQAAKAQAPRKTGCLQDSIVKRVEDYGDSFAIRIVSDTTPCSPTRTSYSLWVHEGTQPHTITAKNGGVLSFMWQGERVYFKSVQHPGTKANKYLADNLRLFAG